MEVNLYHILFIVLICLGLVLALYSKKAITKQSVRSILSLKRNGILNVLEVISIFCILISANAIGQRAVIILSIILLLYIEFRRRYQ